MDEHDRLPFLAVSAPMVRYSKLAFRQLVKRHGVDLSFTPMIMADSFLASAAARHQELPVLWTDQDGYHKDDIVQFAANDPQVFTEAAKLVAPYCSGVDLNCGCPQRWAIREGVGSALLRDPQLVYDMAKRCCLEVPVPVSVKIRLDPQDLLRTVDLCRSLCHMAAVSTITVHGRTPSQRHSDPVDYAAIAAIKESVSLSTHGHVQVFANGDIFTRADAQRVYQMTGVDGVMSARGLLQDPALFEQSETRALSPVSLAREYVDLAVSYGTGFHICHHHVSQMLCGGVNALPAHLHKPLNCLTSVGGIVDFIDTLQ